MSKASDNTKARVKKQIRRIHSVFCHVRPWPFSFLRHSSQILKPSFIEKSYALYSSRHLLKRWLGNEWKPAIV